MPIKITFHLPLGNSKRIQNLVKRYNGRFVRNPFDCISETWFEISFDNPKNYQMFSTMLNIAYQKYF